MLFSKVYRKAIEILNERGWTKGTLEDDNGRVCLYGACGRAENPHQSLKAGNTSVLTSRYSKYVDQANKELFGGHDGVLFNDSTATSMEQVQEVLFRAAELAEAAGE